ncbi:hypothetical protein QQS21_001320 [Conoideocrella luteorostrata]|uniref:CMP/dCMP-type deaminase domain-containing protein n=1 Tax=Conoideocrella luteorostrata TaxID=1105319 RepID=A0AAJ0FYF6_9HYPO|nr:hypothetical protein QQS21_001320 [Conoideocrella luteorostrata]
MRALLIVAALPAHLMGIALGQSPPRDGGGISADTRHYWMRKATEALYEVHHTPCPYNAFGSVIVNHTTSGPGDLVCIGANDNASGNPVLHGEIAAINNCSAILTDPNGPYDLSALQIQKAWADLTLYTNAEPCPMCASAIRWAGFKEVVFGTSIKHLTERGWTQMSLTSEELFSYTSSLRTKTMILGKVLSNETDAYFSWQFNVTADCPSGCERVNRDCRPIEDAARDEV